MTIELSTEELAAELVRRQQQEQQEQERQTAVIREAQQEWSRELLRAHKAREQQLEDEGTASMEAAEKAISDGDLTGAFLHYTGWHASRQARSYLRSSAQSAINRVPGYAGPNIMDLRMVDADFQSWLNQQIHRLAERDGSNRAEEIIGAELPTSYDEATAWLESNRD